MSFVPSLRDRLFGFFLRKNSRGQRLLRRALYPNGLDHVVVRTKYGGLLRIHPDEYIGRMVARHGFYESEVFEALRPFLGRDAVLWDVGANCGLHGLTAKMVSPETTVYSFEPMIGPRTELLRNARLNAATVHVFDSALGDHCEDGIMRCPPACENGRATLRDDYADPSWASVSVRCVRADRLIDDGMAAMPTVMKLDVEGFEYDVLRGLGRFIHDQRLRAIVFEAKPGVNDSRPADDAARYLEDCGFRLTQLERQEPTHHDLENFAAVRSGSR